MRLIDADKLKWEFWENGNNLHTGYEIYRIIEAAPTVDAVPVVRCKDCRRNKNKGSDLAWCPDVVVGSWKPDNWFCKDGEPEEKKDNG